MADAATNAPSRDPVGEVARLVLYWVVAFLILVAALGSVWRADTWFGVIMVTWLVLTAPLVARTARWLADREHEES